MVRFFIFTQICDGCDQHDRIQSDPLVPAQIAWRQILHVADKKAAHGSDEGLSEHDWQQ